MFRLRLDTRATNSVSYIKRLLQITGNLRHMYKLSNNTVRGRAFLNILGMNKNSSTRIVSNSCLNANVTGFLSGIRRS